MNSLKLIKLLSQIQEQLSGIRIPMSKLPDTLTVSSIAAVIDEISHNEHLQATPMTRAKEGQSYYETSSAQKRMYVSDQLKPESLNYNMPSIVRVDGELELDHFKAALNQSVARHENLRTRFLEINGEIVQAIADEASFEVDILELNDDSGEAELVKMLKKDFVKPFDLSRGPLMRVSIIKYGARKHIIFFDFHHTIFDGSSSLLFAQEIMALYSRVELMPLSCQYKDFVKWQNELLESEQIQEQESYWREQLEDAPPASHIPLNYVRPDERTYAGKLVKYEMEPDVTRRIAELCREQGAHSIPFIFQH